MVSGFWVALWLMHSLSAEKRWDSQVISISASWLLAAVVVAGTPPGLYPTHPPPPPEACEYPLLRLYLLRFLLVGRACWCFFMTQPLLWLPLQPPQPHLTLAQNVHHESCC